jgi:hypothetical protein
MKIESKRILPNDQELREFRSSEVLWSSWDFREFGEKRGWDLVKCDWFQKFVMIRNLYSCLIHL